MFFIGQKNYTEHSNLMKLLHEFATPKSSVLFLNQISAENKKE